MNKSKDFFISYNKADRFWAIGIKGWLEDSGYSVVMQQSDFRAGSNFILEMDGATKTTKRVVAVLSPDYLTSEFTAPEWAAAFANDPTGKSRLLIPVRVRDCDLTGLLKQIVYIDLVGLNPVDAAKKLLAEIRGESGEASPVLKQPKSQSRKTSKISQVINGDGNYQAARDININTTKRVQNIVKPGPEHILPEQAAVILEKIKSLGERDENAGLGSTYGSWMNKFKRAFKITSYHLLPSEKYEAALDWIQQQRGMTRSRLRRTDNESWRTEHYTAIHTVRNKLGWTRTEVSNFAISKGIVKKPFESITDLKERQLASLSAAIKREGKRQKR